MSTDARQRLRLIAAFAVVYVVWGSTYFAIRIGVKDLPAALLAGFRFTLAGIVLLAWTTLHSKLPPWRSRDWVPAMVMGTLMMVCANGLTTWAENWVPSNQAALISVSSALWIAWFGTFGRRGHALGVRARIGLGLGFMGAILMFVPGHGFSFEHLGAQLTILVATVCWAAGAIYGRSLDLKTPPLMFAGMQMLFGGVVLVTVGLLSGEAVYWQWTVRGIGAMLYLAAFGSCLAFSTYVWLLRQTTPDKLSTVAYVNPAIAVVLGWVGLSETLNHAQMVGMVVLLGGVILINTPVRSLLRRVFQEQ
ncbi:MAG TPA: EamA family transporter [Gammaproteobacteria bacterium]|nr:EamA family transporter [Gammaproteobacteria bacterium]